MDWKLAIEAEQAALKHIAALLSALADMAELAGGRSLPVRGFVLWILFPAEAAAWNLVTGTPAPIPFRRAGNSPADAMRLASSFRSLATACRDLSRSALLCPSDPEGMCGGRIGVSISATTPVESVSMTFGVWRRTPHDTS